MRENMPSGDRRVTLNSAAGNAGPLPVITTTLASPIHVVSTPIDTKGMGNTDNLLTFTSIISLPLGISVTLNFQIQRVFGGDAPRSIGSNYTYSTTVNILESEVYSFLFKDENVPEGLYTYTVSLSSNSIVDVTPGVTVSAVLSVLAVAVS